MPFPESNRALYRRNPLKEVICQLRFPTILEVTAKSPVQFQNLVRQRYPFYTEEKPDLGLPKEVQDILQSLPLSGIQQTPLHKFIVEEKTRFITLSQEFLAVSELKYERWNNFREEIRCAEQAFRAAYNPSFYSRIGLRYKNFINKKDLGLADEAWDTLLNHSLIGVLGVSELAEEVTETQSQSLIKLSDIAGGFVRIVHGLMKTDNSVYVIDADFFIEKKENLDEAIRTLDQFNQLAARFFNWATSRVLRDALEPIPDAPSR